MVWQINHIKVNKGLLLFYSANEKGNESDIREDNGTQDRKKDRRKQQQVMVHKYKGIIEIKVENFWLIRRGGEGVKE